MKVQVPMYETAAALKQVLPCHLTRDNVLFFCIGGDRSTGDSLGPLVGSELKKHGLPVIGTLTDLVHGANLPERLQEIPKGKTVIAIDASLGRLDSVGDIIFEYGPIKPGSGVGKSLPEVGDYALQGIVNVGGFMEYFVLQNTKLSFVMRMAGEISQALINHFEGSGDRGGVQRDCVEARQVIVI